MTSLLLQHSFARQFDPSFPILVFRRPTFVFALDLKNEIIGISNCFQDVSQVHLFPPLLGFQKFLTQVRPSPVVVVEQQELISSPHPLLRISIFQLKILKKRGSFYDLSCCSLFSQHFSFVVVSHFKPLKGKA